LGETLKTFPTFFGGGLGMLSIKPVKLELIDGEKPYHERPFPVPQSLEATTKKEVKRLTYVDIFNRSSDSEWAAPTFIQAKNTGDVQILTDFMTWWREYTSCTRHPGALYIMYIMRRPPRKALLLLEKNGVVLVVFIDSFADLSFASLTSKQPVEGSITGSANNSFFPLGVLMVNVPMRSTSTLFQSVALSASFFGRSPYFFLTFLPIWHS
jgi:hypothetical protein